MIMNLKIHDDFDAILSVPANRQRPAFSIGIRCDTDQIIGIDYLPPQDQRPPRGLLSMETVRQLQAWLRDPHFVFGLPLAPAGTHFQRRAWQAISDIPTSETRSYGEIARQLGSGPRAVGNACGANPYPIIVPCHRVIATDRGLGGFARQRGGWLLEIKRWLLWHEQR